MRWFLDMCIILYFIGEGDKTDLIKKAKEFAKNKKENQFIVCYYIKEINLPKWIKRQKILFREFIKQIKNENYVPYSSEESKQLYERDKREIIKLKTTINKFQNKKEILIKFEKTINEMERRITNFLKKYVDEYVIAVSEIDFELKSCLFTWLAPNDSDAKTITSGVQEHNKKELIMVTADKKDWNKELLEEVHNDIYLKKKYPKLPEIKYLQNLMFKN